MRTVAHALLLAVAFGSVVLAGCGGRSGSSAKGDSAAAARKDAERPWREAAGRLRKDTDPANVRSVVATLNGDLAARPDLELPPALTPADLQKLSALVPLDEADLRELQPATFTPRDAAYLADAFYLRDAARSLEPQGQAPAALAEQAFAWACRQVYVNPWAVQGPRGPLVPALPPTFVLSRGSGSGLERAYVFLALLQQLGIDGCLVGPPAAGGLPSTAARPGVSGAPTGPFWAVGALADGNVLLFDPWRGEPFPGPGGKGIGTLAQVKADPAAFRKWLDASPAAPPVTDDELKQATAFLAVPVSALAPRLRTLETKLGGDAGVKLYVDPAALRDRFRAAGAPVGGFWNPPGDRFAYSRALAAVLAVEDGGIDPAPRGERLADQARLAQIPRAVKTVPAGLDPQSLAAGRLATAAGGQYLAAFVEPPSPREKTQRGQFNDAARGLVEQQERFARGLDRLQSERESDAVRGWVGRANALYAAVNTAKLNEDEAAARAAQAAVDEFWRKDPGTQLLVDRMTAAAGVLEASYLLAVCKQEVAERQQARLDRADADDRPRAEAAAREAWRVARGAWRAYEERAAGLPAPPGRAEHAAALSARAATNAGADK